MCTLVLTNSCIYARFPPRVPKKDTASSMPTRTSRVTYLSRATRGPIPAGHTRQPAPHPQKTNPTKKGENVLVAAEGHPLGEEIDVASGGGRGVTKRRAPPAGSVAEVGGPLVSDQGEVGVVQRLTRRKERWMDRSRRVGRRGSSAQDEAQRRWWSGTSRLREGQA